MLSKFRIGWRLTGGFIIVAMLCAFVGYKGVQALSKVNAQSVDTTQVLLPQLDALSVINESKLAVQREERNAILQAERKNAVGLKKAQEKVLEKWDLIASSWKSYEALPLTAEEKSILADLATARDNWHAQHNAVMAAAAAGNTAEAAALSFGPTQDAYKVFMDTIDKLLASNGDHQRQNRETIVSTYVSARRTLTVACVLSVLVAIAFGIVLTLSIVRPLHEIESVARSIAEGDIERKVTYRSGDELGALAESFRQAGSYVRDVANAAHSLSIGDLSTQPAPRSSKDVLSANMAEVVAVLRSLVADINLLKRSAARGDFAARADALKHSGDYRGIVEGMNDTLGTVADKVFWYEQMLDAIPFPISVTDMEMNWTFINKPVENLLGVKRLDVLGQPCSNWNANICGTENCGVHCLRRGQLQTVFEQANMDFQVDTVYIQNARGERIGHIEVVQDVSASVKNTVYTRLEVERVTTNLERLAKGDLGFATEASEADKFTAESKRQFDRINASLEDVKSAVGAMIADVDQLSAAAVEGRLATRADAARHHGDFKTVVQGVNDTLDSVVGPVNMAAEFLAHLSRGDALEKITADYKGDFRVIRDNINACVDILHGLLGEMGGLAAAAAEGDLSARADSARYQGDWHQLAEGMNQTLNSLSAPISESAEVLQRVADKDLTARVQGSYKGELAKIKDSINVAVENLEEALQQVAVGADQVANAALEISSGSQSLSQGSSEQASSLEEISSSLQEMASMTRQNAGNAREAKSLADGAKGAADKGASAMQRMSDAVNRIKQSSDQTAKIVKTIDEIAFQTNLLALNAAVEAARAGDAGKGFAVVAEEVRNLAMRSAEAAKNTASMIEEAVKNAEGGVAINREVIVSLNEINEQAAKVSEVMAEIASASEQQTQGIDQVNVAVTEMDTLTQANAANSEESASSAEELSSQAAQMQSMVSAFHLSGLRAQPGASVGPRHAKRPAPRALAAVHAGNGHRRDADASAVIPFDDDAEMLADF
ncbi:MAG TPA: methyl-accepting chemotaxis protein [Armatimonadota bacterium]|jgi:methyl-accepting chemotaxis protein